MNYELLCKRNGMVRILYTWTLVSYSAW